MAHGKNFMRVGYVRISKAGPSRAQQEAALRSAGVEGGRGEALFIDLQPKPSAKPDARHPEREKAIMALRQGDELVIASPSRLGSSLDDVLQALKRIGERKAKLFVVSTGESYRWHRDAIALAEFASLAEREGGAERAKRMRERKAELGGALGGPAPRLQEGSKEWRAAKALWADASKSGAEVAKETGVSLRTLYRLFGDRGTPRFGDIGRRPAKKRGKR